MRALLLLAAIVLILAVVGWISFSSEPGRSSITIETDEIREDTGKVMREGSELLGNVKEEIRDEPSSADAAVPATTN